MHNRTKQEAIKGAFFGALVGDALCLGSHYEYDAQKIWKAYGNKPIDKFMSPGEMMGGQTHGIGWGERNYHPGKKAGGTTDYGDYNILVLEHLAATAGPAREFDVGALIPHWMNRLTHNWGSWICTMTRETFAQVQAGTPVEKLGGISNAMAIRHVAAHGYYDDEETLAKVARKAMFTHTSEEALSGGEFFARVTHRVINGMHPRDAIESVAVRMSPFIQSKVSQAITKYHEAIDPQATLSQEPFADDLALTSMARLWDIGRSEPIRVGKASPTEGTLPGAVYFILKYVDEEEGLKKALQANAMVGGDNASRAIAIGMVLGAYAGINAVPSEWRESLDDYHYCDGLLDKLPLVKL
ncbi:MAG TPA: ADP-ribosylglycohydrolase family protein [Sulfurovum sp.]|nr:MAG: ADP-ribosylglycohydrolase [Sulfurovum sp. 16-42-52]OYZ48295.1 MAG: ADP-ribosylglycohydrolase [Sulfurovum sp. 24-42-9]OZA43935.1 MAG: ADP-ribosylglycohydrolase [Sulfurovum sp. 17-42-90]HQR74773.1 ADP-ribosylglycohydrolase family protein [Sulfurovum sp.]HQS73516.1 ADP-ribosylglycohydrolase family protein [Sulfurovum sp.]